MAGLGPVKVQSVRYTGAAGEFDRATFTGKR